MIRSILSMTIVVLVVLIAGEATGQIRDFGLEARRTYHYAPELPGGIKGWIYRETTGQNGRFYNCDGEEAKRYSPYIDWSTNCHCEYLPTWGTVLRRDIREVKERVRSGACRDGNCVDVTSLATPDDAVTAQQLAKNKNRQPSSDAAREPGRMKMASSATSAVKNQAVAVKATAEASTKSDSAKAASATSQTSADRTALSTSSMLERLFKVR